MKFSRADIPCVLGNGAREAARSTQPVTLYISVNVTPLDLYKSPPTIPTEGDDPPAEEAPIPERVQSSAPEHLPPLSHRPVGTGNTATQSREEMSPTSALQLADEAMKRIAPIDESNTWEGAIERIKWVMDTLGPIAEVRVSPF